ncbi:hypothetical protein ACLOJK_011805 [Asimina triloba]
MVGVGTKTLVNVTILVGILAGFLPELISDQGTSAPDAVSQSFFDGIKNRAGGNCPGKHKNATETLCAREKT